MFSDGRIFARKTVNKRETLDRGPKRPAGASDIFAAGLRPRGLSGEVGLPGVIATAKVGIWADGYGTSSKAQV